MDSGMFRGVGELIVGLFIIAVLAVLSLIGIGVYSFFAADKVESEELIVPEKKDNSKRQ